MIYAINLQVRRVPHFGARAPSMLIRSGILPTDPRGSGAKKAPSGNARCFGPAPSCGDGRMHFPCSLLLLNDALAHCLQLSPPQLPAHDGSSAVCTCTCRLPSPQLLCMNLHISKYCIANPNLSLMKY